MTNAGSSTFGTAKWRKLRDLEERVFTERNTRVFALTWLAMNSAILARLFLSGIWPYTSSGRPADCIDFGWMWISGRFAALGDPSRVYDYAAFAKAQSDLFGAGRCVLVTPFVYPPTLMFFTYPFGRISFVAAFVLWNVILLLFFLAAIYVIVRRANAVIGAPTLRSAPVNIFIGHNGFLTAGLMGFSLTMLEQKPWVAGFFLALLTYKPQFGLLFPIALLASQNWRALASASVFSVMLAAAAAVAFGSHSWPAFFSSLLSRSSGLSPDAAVQLRLMSIYGILQSAGLDARIALAAHAVIALLLAAAVWIVWSRPISYPVRAALLCVAALVASPYAIAYDFCVLAIAFAFLVSDGLRRGFLPGERMVMFLCWLAPFNPGGLRIGPLIVCTVLLYLIYRRIGVLQVQERHA